MSVLRSGAVTNEQRKNLKFLVGLEKIFSKALGLLRKVYRDETKSRSYDLKECKKLKVGRLDAEGGPTVA